MPCNRCRACMPPFLGLESTSHVSTDSSAFKKERQKGVFLDRKMLFLDQISSIIFTDLVFFHTSKTQFNSSSSFLLLVQRPAHHDHTLRIHRLSNTFSMMGVSGSIDQKPRPMIIFESGWSLRQRDFFSQSLGEHDRKRRLNFKGLLFCCPPVSISLM